MANTVQLKYTGAEINDRLEQVMKNVSDLSENFEKDREFRENFTNASYVTSSVLSDYALKSELEPLASKEELEGYQPKGEYLTEHQSLVGYATEQYVDNKISGLLDGVSENFDTLKELADVLTDENSGLGKVNEALNNKANVGDVYDKNTANDTFVEKTKYDELNNKYTTLFNAVYSNAKGETATALNADYVANNLSNTNTSIVITEGELGDVTIPETTKPLSLTAPMADGATVTLSSPKTFTLTNTSYVPVAVAINAPEGTSSPTLVNVSGKYTTLDVNNGSITSKSGATVTDVIINNNIAKSATIGGVVFNDNATITSYNLPQLTIANNNTSGNIIPSATINAEDTTVSLNNSQWNELTSNVSDDTLIVSQYAHINKLIVGKGNVIVYDNNVANRIGEVVNDTTYTVECNSNVATTADEVASLLTKNPPGIIKLGGDFTRLRIVRSMPWSGNYTLDLAGHTLNLTDAMYAIRGSSAVNITITDSVGGGKLINTAGYGLCAIDNSIFTIDVPESTEISAVTHTLFCDGSKKPTINVVNGTYKLIIGSDETDIYDVNGNYKFMLNHLDTTYTREGNCFNITGGTFYGFDPSRMCGDPGEEYSMIDTNLYESQIVDTFVDSRGTTMNIYKVVKK